MAAVWSDPVPSTRCGHSPRRHPTLVLLPGGRSGPTACRPATRAAHRLDERPAVVRRLEPAVYARRRLVVLIAGALLLVLAGVILQRLDRAPVDRSPSAVAGLDASEIATRVHIVQPGETLWEIALTLAPDADPRATVDALVERNGDAPLEVGQRLVLP